MESTGWNSQQPVIRPQDSIEEEKKKTRRRQRWLCWWRWQCVYPSSGKQAPLSLSQVTVCSVQRLHYHHLHQHQQQHVASPGMLNLQSPLYNSPPDTTLVADSHLLFCSAGSLAIGKIALLFFSFSFVFSVNYLAFNQFQLCLVTDTLLLLFVEAICFLSVYRRLDIAHSFTRAKSYRIVRLVHQKLWC